MLAVFAALLLLSWLLAHWTWVFLTPRQMSTMPESPPPMLSKVLAEKAVALHLFGGGDAGGVASPGTAEAAAPVAAPSNIGIRGIYAGGDGRSGFAVLVVDGKAESAVVGQEFVPGMVLRRVFPDYVEILRGEQVEIVRLPTAPVSVAGMSPLGGGNGALAIAVQQWGPGQYGFSRKELLSLLKRPDQMSLLGRYAPHPRGGAVLERSPSGGLPEKLGLKVGDVVTSLNGKPLAGPGDVARLYQILIKSESVNVDILRAGEKKSFSLLVSP